MNAARPLAALLLSTLASSLVGCAASKAESRVGAPPPAADAAPMQSYPSSTQGPMPASMPTAAPPPPPPAEPASPNANPLWVEFERVDRELALSTGDCATACRALASLERAANRVCEGSAQLGEAARCGDAMRRLRDARGRVRSACTRCAGGPSTEPDAPPP
ncbi:MAG: hypothetical protein MUF34_02080 [Polyangiaceae bacterium]|nr:hypothetical protein [Polyangiaceae bacterium]